MGLGGDLDIVRGDRVSGVDWQVGRPGGDKLTGLGKRQAVREWQGARLELHGLVRNCLATIWTCVYHYIRSSGGHQTHTLQWPSHDLEACTIVDLWPWSPHNEYSTGNPSAIVKFVFKSLVWAASPLRLKPLFDARDKSNPQLLSQTIIIPVCRYHKS